MHIPEQQRRLHKAIHSPGVVGKWHSGESGFSSISRSRSAIPVLMFRRWAPFERKQHKGARKRSPSGSGRISFASNKSFVPFFCRMSHDLNICQHMERANVATCLASKYVDQNANAMRPRVESKICLRLTEKYVERGQGATLARPKPLGRQP